MQQGQRREFGIGSISLLAAALCEVFASFQAADANTLVEIESRAPAPLKALLESMPELPVFPQHAWRICPQALGQYLCGRLRCLPKGSRDAVVVGPMLDSLSKQPPNMSVMARPESRSGGWVTGSPGPSRTRPCLRRARRR